MSKKDRNIIGPAVRRLRVEKELSQEALAARLQIAGLDWSRVSLAKIESRIKQVTDAELFVLAKVLRTPIADLYPSETVVKKFIHSKAR